MLPNQFREFIELDVDNMKVSFATVFDGKKAWAEVRGKVVKLEGKILDELKEAGNLVQVGKLKPLLDKQYELALIGEVKVEGKPCVGVRVSTKGAKDISLFFDKKTGILTKLERQAIDADTLLEVQEERIIRSYKDKDGRKIPHEIAVLRDGTKFLEMEITEFTPLDDVELSEFEMPK